MGHTAMLKSSSLLALSADLVPEGQSLASLSVT